MKVNKFKKKSFTKFFNKLKSIVKELVIACFALLHYLVVRSSNATKKETPINVLYTQYFQLDNDIVI